MLYFYCHHSVLLPLLESLLNTSFPNTPHLLYALSLKHYTRTNRYNYGFVRINLLDFKQQF